MPSYSTNLRLIQPSVGEYPGSWGTEVNNSLTALVDRAIAGTANITMTAGNYTLNNANGVDDDGKAMFLVLGGTPGASYQVICPAISKLYFVTNSTGFAQTVKTAAGSGISVPNGASMTLRCDGVNVVTAANYFGQLSSAYTANGVMYLNGSNVVTTGSGLVFDGSNLGIGTSSPLAKLDVFSSGATLAKFTRDLATDATLQIGADNDGPIIEASGINTMRFFTSAAERMRLDSSGNLGLGVTPSAWGAGAKAVQFSSGAFAGAGISVLSVGNAYFDGTNYRYLANGFAAYHAVNNGAGQHAFYVAPSGTAGNAISFTQAMTLDVSGNLGVGVVPGGSYKFQVSTTGGSAAQFISPQGNPQITASDNNVTVYVGYTSGSGASALSYFGTATNHAQAFLTNNIERARITSGGDLLVGATSTINSAKLLVSATGSDAIIRISNNTSGNAVLALATEGVDGGDVYYERSTSRLYVKNSATGGVYLSTNATAWTAVSDERLKTALTPIEGAASKVSSLRAVTGRYKTDADDVSRSFLLAQDVQAVFPEAVNADNPDELGLSYTDMVPLLVAAIKEQQALINDLRARVAALEAQP